MKLRVVLLYVAVAALGLLLGRFVPPAWQLAIFFAAIAFTVATAIAAHSYPDPKVRSRSGAAALFIVALLLIGPGGEIKQGRGPLYFALSMLFTVAFVGGLALAHSAA